MFGRLFVAPILVEFLGTYPLVTARALLHDRVVDLMDEGLDVAGLMAVGPTGPPEAARAGFALLARTVDRLDLGVRSMGMTGDLEVAVGEGATMVLVGAGLFGPRELPSAATH